MTNVRLVPRFILIVALALTAGACASSGSVPRPFPGAGTARGGHEPAPVPVDPATGRPLETGPADLPPATSTGFGGLVDTALMYLGVPYRNGGSDPSGFDCSGLVQWVFARFGISLPREVKDQYDVGSKVDLDEVMAGDLLFFETIRHGASHVAIALGNGRMVHAPSSNGVVRVERYTSYWSSRFVGARRIENAGDQDAESDRIILPGSVRTSR
jgi:cell wall-associated NlpC family hydrolase